MGHYLGYIFCIFFVRFKIINYFKSFLFVCAEYYFDKILLRYLVLANSTAYVYIYGLRKATTRTLVVDL